MTPLRLLRSDTKICSTQEEFKVFKTSTTIPSFSRYMRWIRSLPKLTSPEERDLACRYAKGDADAGMALVVAHLSLVVHLARQLTGGRPQLDAIQEGNLGLLLALERFDADRGVRFSTYASHWIRARLFEHLRASSLIKTVTTKTHRKLYYNLEKTRERLITQGVDPTPERLAQELDVSPDDILEMNERLAHAELSLDLPIDPEGHRRIQDTLIAPTPSPEKALDQERLQQVLSRFRDTLPEREQRIWDERTLSEYPKTCAALGRELSISRERVRQLERQLIEGLGQYLARELPEAAELPWPH